MIAAAAAIAATAIPIPQIGIPQSVPQAGMQGSHGSQGAWSHGAGAQGAG